MITSQDISRLHREVNDFAEHPAQAATLLVSTLADWLDADAVDLGRRTTRTGPGTFEWTPSAWYTAQPTPSLEQLEAFHRHRDFCLPMSDRLIASPKPVDLFVASLTPMPELPAPSARILRTYLDLLNFADSINLKTDALGQPGYTGWVSVKRSRPGPNFTAADAALVSEVVRGLSPCFWAAQRTHLDALAFMDARD